VLTPHNLSPWLAFRAALAVCLAPVAIGMILEVFWLTQVGFIVLFVFIMACYGLTLEQQRREREEREREEKDFDR
jgi:hypothetical protein